MDGILSQFIAQLSPEQRIELLGALREAIAAELAGPVGEPRRCPRCECKSFVRKGYDRCGAQRYLCRGCGRTFTAKSMGLLACSKLPEGTWMEFACCMADRLSLRESASRCGVSLYTAWFMRMRVCEVMARRTSPARPGTFWVDETCIKENLSGNHARSFCFSMPRKPHRNGQDARHGTRGRSKTNFTVVCGINEHGDAFCSLGERGAEGSGHMALVCRGHIPEGSAVITDENSAYPGALGQWCSHSAFKSDGPYRGRLAPINALHSRLKAFLAPMHGVAIRRLQRYLDWFCYCEQFKHTSIDRRELLYSHEAQGTYIYTRQLTHLEAHPEYWWWARRVNAGLT